MGSLKIEVIGPGCRFCKKLYSLVQTVVTEENIEAELSHVTELKQVMRYIPLTPVLKVNGEIVHRGKFLPSKGKIAAMLFERIR